MSRSSSAWPPAHTVCVHCGKSRVRGGSSWSWRLVCCLGSERWQWDTTGCSSECPQLWESRPAERGGPEETGRWMKFRWFLQYSHEAAFWFNSIPVQWFVWWCLVSLLRRIFHFLHPSAPFLGKEMIHEQEFVTLKYFHKFNIYVKLHRHTECSPYILKLQWRGDNVSTYWRRQTCSACRWPVFHSLHRK